VDHAGRVGLGEAGARLQDVVDRAPGRQPTLGADRLAEIAPGEELHREEGLAPLVGALVEDAHGVLAVQAHGGLSLAGQARARVGAPGVAVVEALDRDPPPGAEVLGRQHHAHPALGQGAEHAVPAAEDRLARGGRVVGGVVGWGAEGHGGSSSTGRGVAPASLSPGGPAPKSDHERHTKGGTLGRR